MTTLAAPAGWLRTFFGPSRTPAETILGLLGGAAVIAMLVTYIRHAGGWHDWSALQIVIVAVTGLDLVGGVFTISATTASCWYHRPGPAAQRFRMTFVISHAVLYLVPVTAVFGLGWTWMLANAGLLLGAAALIEGAPVDLKRMVALALTLIAALANRIWLPIPSALQWLPLLLMVKVLVCFLLPALSGREAPADQNCTAGGAC
ncbi:hypothetical protein [[Mycobacterium] nativiensis]|uniref:Uncharacterized protein n=1 Tax=[Mycobacterium] nativiensis TaxID=2855503 RepID=A0ABU5Y1R6_9MYCO|nr:hypothetical protein [Mycolicibacter sp. MYC340]MEB3034185.1 hypothetical protein [Mycolicibacter sp. MYC340]